MRKTAKPGMWNYLRVRGEYLLMIAHIRANLELPPRARRIHIVLLLVAYGVGTTSACAENTCTDDMQQYSQWNYLRVRGEYGIFLARVVFIHGTTSACAENTAEK